MKKNRRKVLLCAVLAAMIVLAGCGKERSGRGQKNRLNQAGQEVEDISDSMYQEFMTVDVFDTVANYQGIQSGWFAKVVKDKFNMELNIIAPNVTGGETLFDTRAAAGNLGDLIITGTEGGRFKSMVNAGLLMDMTDLLKGKDILENYETAVQKANAHAQQEGIYAIPSEISVQSPEVSTDGIDSLVAPFVRWDAYQAAGYPKMKTLEDWIHGEAVPGRMEYLR